MIHYEFYAGALPAALEVPDNYQNALYFSTSEANHNGNMVGIIIDGGRNEVIIKYGISGALPIFWAWYKDKLVVSDSLDFVRQKIYRTQVASYDEIDKIGLLEAIMFDGPLAERTLFQGISKLQIGQVIKFSLEKKSEMRSWFWLPQIQVANSGDFSDEVSKEKIMSLLDNNTMGEDEVVLPLTGGLDSRLIACLVKDRWASKIHSYTFQRGASYESYCARKLAQSLEIEHSIFNLGRECYVDFARKSARRSGGMVTGMHTHGIYCCEEMLSPELRHAPRIFGYYGDPITGAMTEDVKAAEASNSIEGIFNKYQRTLFPTIIGRYKSDILNDISNTFTAFKVSGSAFHTFHEFWKIHQRQNNLIGHLFSYHRSFHGVKIINPFVNREFADYFLALPLNQRINRTHFKKIARELYPDFFSLPSIHYSPSSSIGIFDKGISLMEKMANKLFPKQEVVLSPFSYEHHEKNLINYLSDDVIDGSKKISEIYDCQIPKIFFPSWRSSSPKEFYRLCSISYILGNSL